MVTGGVSSTTKVMGVFPGATITVFNSGTVVPASIFGDNLGSPTPKSNPFTSDSNTGLGFFYAANGRYDVQISGVGFSTFTLGDIELTDPADPTTVGSLTVTGNTSVGGTLGVTGSTTLSGNATVGGTLGVTGTTTLANTNIGTASTLGVNNIKQQAGASFALEDPLGVSHFFISSSAPYTNTFVNGNGAGVIFLGAAAKTSVDDVTGNITMSGTTSGTTIIKPTAIASGTLTFPATTDTLVGKATTDTLTNKTLTAPVINGTPTGTGIPTVTLKTGSGGGNYTTSSTSFVRADTTNLAFTVTIPTGWKLLINASGAVSSSTGAGGVNVALADGSADNTGILISVALLPAISGAGQFSAWALTWAIAGDGASHTINLQFDTGNAADAAILVNSSATLKPMMTFLLVPSN